MVFRLRITIARSIAVGEKIEKKNGGLFASRMCQEIY